MWYDTYPKLLRDLSYVLASCVLGLFHALGIKICVWLFVCVFFILLYHASLGSRACMDTRIMHVIIMTWFIMNLTFACARAGGGHHFKRGKMSSIFM